MASSIGRTFRRAVSNGSANQDFTGIAFSKIANEDKIDINGY